MATKSKKLPTLVSPPVEVKYSHLVKPNTKFNADGEFQLTVVLDPSNSDHAGFMRQLDTLAQAARTEKAADSAKVGKYALRTGYKNEEDKDGEETGKVLVSFKNGASFEYKGETIHVKIPVVDAKNNPIVNSKVGRGSIVKVAYQAVPFAMDATKQVGISLRLAAVRVLKYVPFSGSAASAFGEAEEGFEYEGDGGFPDETPAETTDAPKGDSSNGDF